MLMEIILFNNLTRKYFYFSRKFPESGKLEQEEELPKKLMLLRNSVIVMLEAPAGIVVTWIYPFGRGFFANTPVEKRNNVRRTEV